MAGGGLDQALAARADPLDGAARLRIAGDVAAGLGFLHGPGAGLAPMLHRDVKSSNVLLDAGLRARVSDVGLARPQHGATMTAGVGTFGYLDPHYFTTGERRRHCFPAGLSGSRVTRGRGGGRRVHAGLGRLLFGRHPA
jgi:serine/threonine protein kinase